MKIKVLLIDDEPHKLLAFKDIAEQNNIEIIKEIRSADKAIEELKNNSEKYDAIILDGIFFLNENSTESEKEKVPLINVITYIRESSLKIPWFILSGNPAFTRDVNEELKAFTQNKFSNKIFKKRDDDELQDLCDNIKRCVRDTIKFKIKEQYQQAFDSYDELFIDSPEFEKGHKALIDILSNISEPKEGFDDLHYYPRLRIILELIFRKAHKHGLLPDIALTYKGEINLTNSKNLLSGWHVVITEKKDEKNIKKIKHQLEKTHFDKIIITSVEEILLIIGEEAHTIDLDLSKNKKLFEFKQRVKTPYLLYKMTFEILDIIIWFNSYLKENSDYEINKSYWIQSEIKSFYKKD